MYRVTRHFFDLTDGGHSYDVGDAFPRPGKEVGEARIKSLSTNANKRGVPLIEAVEAKPKKEAKDDETSDAGNAKGKSGKAKQRK